jgi:carboxyl-terminal processing protease
MFKHNIMKKLLFLSILITGVLGIATTLTDDFEISKNLEIYSNIYRNLNVYYVDEVDPEKLMENGLEAMLNSMDPYTTYIPAEEVEQFQSTITGRYGGLGASIFQQDGYVTIAEVYENSPAQKAGLRAGDKMKASEGKSLKGLSVREVSTQLRGLPGSQVEIEVIRPGQKETLKLKIEREEVNVKNIPYYGIMDGGIAYIALTAFTENAGKNVQSAFMELKDKQELKGVVLDLRGNTGGLLTEAVNVVNVFVERGEEVVSIKGRNKERHKRFQTLNKPVDTEIPLTVLIDERSASASEIVAGALQDKDRAVIIGQKSYGKGLVQNTFDLAYGAKLKMTTARYYVPSGRCIQSLNYKDGKAVEIPDSLRSRFVTEHGRVVLDGGGIQPDLEMKDASFDKIMQTLNKDQHIFNFAVEYRNANPSIADPKDFKLSDKDFEDFLAYLKAKNYDYSTETESALASLKKKAIAENYEAALSEEIKQMQQILKQDKLNVLKSIKAQLLLEIQKEIVLNYYLESGALKNMLQIDPEILKAKEILSDQESYKAILSPKKN